MYARNLTRRIVTTKSPTTHSIRRISRNVWVYKFSQKLTDTNRKALLDNGLSTSPETQSVSVNLGYADASKCYSWIKSLVS